MTIHPTEEELVDAYYNPANLTAHIDTCADCRSAYQSIAEALDAANEASIPERGPGYGGEVWQRLLPRMPQGRSKPSWFFACAAAALLTIVFALGMFTEHTRTAPAPEAKDERGLYMAVSDHMEQAQILLTELVHSGPAEDREREQARDLIMLNRILRLRAIRDKDAADAAVLDDLERVLMEVANSDSNLQAVRHRVEGGDLLSRVRISGSHARVHGEKL